MGFLTKLGRLFSSPRPAFRYLEFQVRCQRCGEVLEGRIDLYNDPSLDYEADKAVYFCRKVLLGSQGCFQQVEATFKFDEERKVIEKHAAGGEFVD